MGGAGCYQEGSLRLCEKSAQFHILVLIVQGDNDRSQCGNREVADNEMQSVRKKQGDSITTANSHPVELSGEREDAVIKFSVG